MHTTKQIIDNQTKFKENIFSFLLKEQSDAKKLLDSIKSEDKFIKKEKNKLKNRFKKIKQTKYIEHLFFLNSNRNLSIYVWWDDDEKEAKILTYDKR